MKNIFRKLINSTLVVGTLAVCASCFNFDGDGHRRRGNGHLVSIERGVRPFEKIHSEGSCDIRFYASNEYRVVITVDENLERFVEVYSDNNTLHIDTERGHSYSFTEFTVDVYCPTLSKVSMLGSGSFEGVDAIVARSFEAYLSGSGSVSAGVDCDYFLAKILGSGEVAVGGVCG
ncbi:MAG: DUF2807 domain-containing protein, partial [Prevotellaceae bacterium]|nr:DUF2807 domain-containing protein [Prevotellaceae bacterium]